MCCTSRSPCGERGLKCWLLLSLAFVPHSRSPCGERGLKYRDEAAEGRDGIESLPVRGAWVEITGRMRRAPRNRGSLPVRGAWVEIALSPCNISALKRRSPCGERGLKYYIGILPHCPIMSLPVRGAWVEMGLTAWRGTHALCRSPCGERGLKLYHLGM